MPKCGDCRRLNLVCTRTSDSAKITTKAHSISVPSPTPSPSSEEDTNSVFFVGSGTGSPAFRREVTPILENSWSGPAEFIEDCVFTSSIGKETSAPINYSAKYAALTFETPLMAMPFNVTAPQDQHLLRHFIRVVSRTLSIVHDDDANPFLKLIVPLAGSSEVVMESLLALSASHLRGVYPEILQRGLAHQSKALGFLNSIISKNIPSSAEQTLAAVLLLCMIEICDGNSTKWSWHISAAQTIIRSKSRSKSSSTTWKFLLAMFGYVDSVITISNCQAPLITLEELTNEGEPNMSRDVNHRDVPYTSHSEALFGVAQPLFNIIGKISGLAHRRKERVDEISDIWFRQSAKSIEESLRVWEPPSLTSHLEWNRTDISNAAYAIKWASILRLHQVVDGYCLSDPCVRECTSNILTYVSRIRFGSSVESILIFPLVMAAAGAADDEQRVCVKERWMVMERTIGFDNVARARQMVEAVWNCVDDGRKSGANENGEAVNWAKIRYFDFPGVVLL
ncbi:hypothetical protein BP6252_05491 [Coleophoma cylindrospora]|uniref:Zn(2)-C6 fungal-type domain-containing protein n=1 Tax=Coleophoma cylindrospora TaxID=1849047 RepID=A0A3D8RU00_9HELO|nr:hypothetical protein BP6252_05491 [Coleophoma cylindrospora]